MANKAARVLYECIVKMHPAAFRDEFGSEMVLDFEEGTARLGFARLYTDALISLGRQWLRDAVRGGLTVWLSRRPCSMERMA